MSLLWSLLILGAYVLVYWAGGLQAVVLLFGASLACGGAIILASLWLQRWQRRHDWLREMYSEAHRAQVKQ